MPPKKSAALEELWTKKLKEAMIITDRVAKGETDAVMPKELKKTRAQWYQQVYGVCAADVNAMKELHNHLKVFVETHLAPALKERIKPAIDQEKGGEIDSAKLFDVVAKVYGEFSISKSFANAVCSSLDQGLSGREGVPKIDEMYLKAFHGLVYSDVKAPLRESILRHVSSRRDGNEVNMKTLKNATDFLLSVGTSAATSTADRDEIYHSDFEKHYLDCLTEAYKGKARAELSRDGGHYTYLQWVDSRFELERNLMVSLCWGTSHTKIFAKLEELLLRDQMAEVINHEDSGFGALLDDWKENNIRQMYTLFKRVPNNEAITLMKATLKNKTKEVLKPFINLFEEETSEQDRHLVDKNMETHKKFTSMVKNLCKNDNLLQEAIKDGFVDIINSKMKRKVTKPGSDEVTKEDAPYAQVLSVFLDAALKGEYKDISDPDQEIERLESLAVQFSYLTDKDVFSEYYRAKLAKRLLMGDPKEDLERSFLGFIQKIQGSGFTHKMEGMLNDRERAGETNEAFLQKYRERIECDFKCQVLAQNNWPSYKADKLRPAESLQKCLTAFQFYYKEKFTSRELIWLHQLGKSELKIAFPKGPKEITIGSHQAHVLMYIDTKGSITGGDLADAMGLEWDKQVKPNIMSMYMSKVHNMICHGVSEDGKTGLPAEKAKLVKETTFSLNPSFVHKMRKFKVTGLTAGGGGGTINKEDIDKGRAVVIDACIVRVMKSRRTMVYNELLDEVVRQLSKLFQPQPRQIKQQIETLITREYLKRDPDQPSKFEYLA